MTKARSFPLIFFLLFSIAMIWGLNPPNRNSRIIGQAIPPFSLTMLGSAESFTPDLWKGQTAIINVFASWCKSCLAEHDALLSLAETGVPIYGVAWKDTPDQIQGWLKEHGNPYKAVGLDNDGVATVPLALSGVPETLVVTNEGKVIYHHKSTLSKEAADEIKFLVKNQ